MTFKSLCIKIISVIWKYGFIFQAFPGNFESKNNEICDIKKVSNYLGVSIPEIRKLVRSKRIPYFRVGNRLRFDIVKVNKWLDDLEAQEGKNPLFIW